MNISSKNKNYTNCSHYSWLAVYLLCNNTCLQIEPKTSHFRYRSAPAFPFFSKIPAAFAASAPALFSLQRPFGRLRVLFWNRTAFSGSCHHNLVHPALELAVDDDYIRKNPSKGVYRSLKSEGSGKPAKTRIALTKEQQKNFLRFISKSPMYSHWLPVMVVLLGTGLRVGECTGLTKNDVDLENNTISVNHNLIYRVIDGKAGFHITTPKTASGTRTIPILYPEVAEQLRALIEVMDALYPEDLVMNGYHGFLFRNRSGYFLSAHNINRAIERISIAYNAEEMDQAELEDREPDLLPHFSVHNLRHTFCTRLCESTNDIKFIQQVMGHADFSTTMDIYTHITQENMKEKAEVIKGNLVLM